MVSWWLQLVVGELVDWLNGLLDGWMVAGVQSDLLLTVIVLVVVRLL